jgi:hypothetical protein
MRHMSQFTRGCAIGAAAALGGAIGLRDAAAQDRRDNIYRYVLDIDVPESPGLVALDLLSTKVLRGSSPKPFTANVVYNAGDSSGAVTGVSLDLVPYYLLGGGRRRLGPAKKPCPTLGGGVIESSQEDTHNSYRSDGIPGRLLRVITKTALSLAVSSAPASDGSLLGAIALRTTFHDPHDAVLNSCLPEQVDSALAAHDVAAPDLTEEDLGGRGVDLEPVFEAASRSIRARGDVQVSAGWGLAGHLRGGSLKADSLDGFRHTLWITGQHATGHLLDVIATVQFHPALRADDNWRFGAGIQRKSRPADLRLQLYYDTGSRRFHPGAIVEAHPTRGFLVTAGLTSEAVPRALRASADARVVLTAQWYPTARR